MGFNSAFKGLNFGLRLLTACAGTVKPSL